MTGEPIESSGLKPGDLALLAEPIAEEVALELPMPATVTLFLPGWSSCQPVDIPLSGEVRAAAEQSLQTRAAALVADNLLVPLCGDGCEVVVVIGDVDVSMLAKMARTWLEEMQQRLLRLLLRIRQIYIEPAFQMYNSRALALVFQGHHDGTRYFFLLSASFQRRSAVSAMQRLERIAGHLQGSSDGLLFSLGNGVFGLLQSFANREQARAFSQGLQRRCKREGLARIQAAFCQLAGEGEGACTLDQLWQGLTQAEQRGPMGLLEVGHEREPHPFGLPGGEVLARLRRQWRGSQQFAMVAVEMHGGAGEEVIAEACSLLQSQLAIGQGLLAEGCRIYLCLPGCGSTEVQARMSELGQVMRKRYGRKGWAMGASLWPCLSYSRTDALRNCGKALMHGSFYGPGAMVLLDSLTLNVSGDFYFDQGDLRTAMREYRNGLRIKADDVNLLNSLGVTLAQVDRNREALEVFSRVLALDPDNYMALVNLGYVRLAAKEPDQALECFDKAMSIKLHSGASGTELFFPLARLHLDRGRAAIAMHVLERWQREDGEREYLYHRLLAEALTIVGDNVPAMQAAQRALRLNPMEPVCLSLLGLLYVLEGEGDDVGLSLLRKALARDGFNADNWFRLARALAFIGQSDAALEALGRCRNCNRGHLPARLLEARLHRLAGRSGRARVLLQAILHRVGGRGEFHDQAREEMDRLGGQVPAATD